MTGWPDPSRPGVPLNPERDGWHWLIESGGRTHPDYWIAAHPGWRYAGLAERARTRASAYLGPCLTPSEVQTQLAAARREGAEEMRERAARVLEDEAAFLDANAFARPRCPVETKREDAAAIRALAVEGGAA